VANLNEQHLAAWHQRRDGETRAMMRACAGHCEWWVVAGTGTDRDFGRVMGSEVAWVRGACRTPLPEDAQWFATRELAAAAAGEVDDE
jgi:hypothetical protein